MKIIKRSNAIVNYKISIIRNVEEKFSPQQRKIFTFHISGYNTFLKTPSIKIIKIIISIYFYLPFDATIVLVGPWLVEMFFNLFFISSKNRKLHLYSILFQQLLSYFLTCSCIV